MTVPAYTIYGSHPRLWWRDSDKAAITARTDSTDAWKSLWDGTIIPAANSYKNYSNAALAGIGNPENRFMVLCLVGFVEETGRPAGGYLDAAIRAAVYLAGLPDSSVPTNFRYRCLALSLVFDACYNVMTTSERNAIAAAAIYQAGRASWRTDEYMDGHSGNDQFCALTCGLAVHGWGSYNAQGVIDDALEFWWGTGAADGPEAGRWAWPRYAKLDGGSEQGSWYTVLEQWCETEIPWILGKATDLDVFSSESSWMSKAWEWYLNENWTGATDHDYYAQGDTAKLSSTWFHYQMRQVWGILASKFPGTGGTQGGHMLRWLWDQWDAIDNNYADTEVWQVLFLDRAGVAPVHPKDATTPPSTSRLFDPPGIYYFRWTPSGVDDWDYDEQVLYRISARKRYFLGHPHLDAGSVRLSYKGDRLLEAPSGLYDVYGGTHHKNALQRSWTQSLVPLVHDPAAVWTRYGDACERDGGQQYKKYAGRSDPERVYYMLTDAGGEAWLRTRSFTKHVDNASVVFLSADIEPGYRRTYTDAARCNVLKVKYLLIKPNGTNGLSWPALLYYARVVKRDASWRVQIPLHSRNAWSSTSYGATTTGPLNLGKLWLDIRNISAYTRLNVPPGTPLDSNGYGPNEWRLYGDGPTAWPPSASPKTREVPDVKRHSFYVEKTSKVQEEHYVLLLMPTGVGDSEPVAARAWVSDGAEPDWYGVTLGGGETYMVHRTQDLCSYPTAGPDTTPPGEVTGLSLAARNGALLATWTDPGDSDLDKVLVYYRTSAVT